jgi:hypothetical protein
LSEEITGSGSAGTMSSMLHVRGKAQAWQVWVGPSDTDLKSVGTNQVPQSWS